MKRMTKFHIHFQTRRGTGLVEDLTGLKVHPAEGCATGWGIDCPGHVRTVEADTKEEAVARVFKINLERAKKLL